MFSPNHQSYNWGLLTPEQRNYARGLWGEYALNRALNVELGAVRYGQHHEPQSTFLFDRIHTPSLPGKTTEVDCLFVSQKGVISFEVKSWSGDAIMGDRNAESWFTANGRMSNGRPGVKAFRTDNPFLQNDHHVKCLKTVLPDGVHEALFSIVLLIDSSGHVVKPGKWAGEDIEGLFTDVDSVIKSIKNAPAVLSDARVHESASILAQFPYGAEFSSFGLPVIPLLK